MTAPEICLMCNLQMPNPPRNMLICGLCRERLCNEPLHIKELSELLQKLLNTPNPHEERK